MPIDAFVGGAAHGEYGADAVAIEISILQRASERELKQRLALAREWF